MSLIQMLILGIIPAGLLMWIGNTIRSREANGGLGKRWFWFLAGGLGASTVAFIVAALLNESRLNFFLLILAPIIFGFAVTLGFYLIQNRQFGLWKIAPLFLLILLLFSWLMISDFWLYTLLSGGMGILTVFAWLGWERNGRRTLIFFVIEVLLLAISIQVTDMNRIADMNPRWLGSILNIGTFLIIPWIGVVMAALLIRRLLVSEHPFNWRTVSSTLLMVVVLLLMIGYQGMLVSMWDIATDGLGWVFLLMTTSTIGIGSAMLIAWSLSRRQLWVSILFALTVPSVLLQAHNLANYDKDHKWGTKPIITTERRAEKIDTAIQRYYDANNGYPQVLNDLTPRYLLYIPSPFIIPGLDWCYEGGTDHYRFGYVYRQYFSTPASVRIHSSAGEPPDPYWKCQDEADIYSAPLGF